MPINPNRKLKIPVVVDHAMVDEVRELAAREHEGNLSRMVRELIREALRARELTSGDFHSRRGAA